MQIKPYDKHFLVKDDGRK